jgi:CxxC motif-containing protein (DUF1111 family)
MVRQLRVQSGRGFMHLPLPPQVAYRKPPPLYGLGLLEGVPETVVREYEDPADRDGDGVSGRAAVRDGRLARFGWKARYAKLEQAIASALINELGLTNAVFPHGDGAETAVPDAVTASPELDMDSIRALSAFVRELPPLSRPRRKPVVATGEQLFQQVGCERCHRARLQTNSRSVAVMDGVIKPYTDLLLHDMGSGLTDAIREGEADQREFRTPPLWGIAMTGPPYLHDGRASTLEQAIDLHGGEGAAAAKAFRDLRTEQRALLLAFLSDL